MWGGLAPRVLAGSAMAASVLAALVLAASVMAALVLAGCGSARGPAAKPGPPRPTAARPCSRPVVVGTGAVVDGWRMGALTFSSAQNGVGVTAAEVWCNVSLGREGVEPTLVPQTVLFAVTHDGGARWTTVGTPAPGATLHRTIGGAGEQVVAASPARAWLLTAGGHVLATTDEGRSWAGAGAPAGAVQLRLTRGRLWVLACPAAAGRSVRCRLALARLDVVSGRWTRLSLPERQAVFGPQLAVFGDTAVVDAALDTSPPEPLLVSGDDGRRWRGVALPRWDGRACPVPSAFAAAGAQTWWWVCIGGAAAGSSEKALFQTTNGGRTWHVLSQVDSLVAPERPGQIPLAEPNALAAGSSSRLWLALQNGLAVTSDGGRRWTAVRSVDPQGIGVQFDVRSARTAWLLAPGAALWRTTDGIHWRLVGPDHAG